MFIEVQPQKQQRAFSDSTRGWCWCQSSGTSYFELLQVSIVLGAVEEEPGLPLRALDEAVRGQQLLDDAGLAQRCRSTVGVPVVSIVVEQVWIKAHLGHTKHRQRTTLSISFLPSHPHNVVTVMP